jgi:GTPase involved in cell partitioning and DNA repair
MLGEAREKFATIAGPQGGTSLNGASLKQEAQAEMEKLETEVSMSVAGGTGYGFLIG